MRYQDLRLCELLAGVLAVLLLIAPGPDVSGYVAIINDASQQSVWMISTTADMNRFYVKNMKPLDVPPSKRCVLWLQSEDSQAIYAVGALPEQGEEMTLGVDKNLHSLLPGKLWSPSRTSMDLSPPNRAARPNSWASGCQSRRSKAPLKN